MKITKSKEMIITCALQTLVLKIGSLLMNAVFNFTYIRRRHGLEEEEDKENSKKLWINHNRERINKELYCKII